MTQISKIILSKSSFIYHCLGNSFENRKENRHYYNREYHIRIDCYLWLPEHNILGYDEETKKHKQFKNKFQKYELCYKQYNSSQNKQLYTNNLYIQYENPIHNFNYSITSFLTNVIQNIMPDYLILNQGLWKFPKLHNDYEYFHSFFHTAQKSTKKLIWKTTTASCDDMIVMNQAYYNNHGMDTKQFIAMLKQLNIEIFDAFLFTKDITKFNSRDLIICWDRSHHFQSFVYRELNKQLLKMLLFPGSSNSSGSSSSRSSGSSSSSSSIGSSGSM